ncbi:MAG: hypothetical protein K0S82_89 [Gaiellaceae bacterium]|nr:hypothetical protein [Gaiellaceae bacterium]
MSTILRTGYEIREGAAMIAARVAAADHSVRVDVDLCECGETRYRGRCYNVGGCRDAERAGSAQSLRRGSAASAAPAAWNLGGRVD